MKLQQVTRVFRRQNVLALFAGSGILALCIVIVSLKVVINGLHEEQILMREKHGHLEKKLEQRIEHLELLGMNADTGPVFVRPEALSNAKALREEERREEARGDAPSGGTEAQQPSSPAEAQEPSSPAEADNLVEEPTSTTSSTPLRGIGRHVSAPPRALGGIFGNIAAHGSATSSTGCVTIALSSAVTLDLSSASACNSNKCPPCFIVTTGHASNKLTLSACSAAKVSNSISLGTSSTVWANAIMEIIIINSHTTAAIVRDGGSTDNIVGPGSVSIAYCYTGGSNALYFTSPYFYNGLHTGSGYSGTGATLTGSGALSVDSSITAAGAIGTASTLDVTGAATFHGSAQLGDASGDAVTLPGTLNVDGAATFQGATQLGDATGDTVTIEGNVATAGAPNIDFTGSSGTFGTCSGANTISGAVTAASTLNVDGAATFQGAIQLGDATGDTITLKGHVTTGANINIDLDDSSGTFTFPTGNCNTGGCTTR
jgi:hypothetical protein